MQTRSGNTGLWAGMIIAASALAIVFAPAVTKATDDGNPTETSAVDSGRYLVTIGGCNDCHTAGWSESNGATPEADWLTGLPIGWRGPWGTTYASNLRITVSDMSEDAWVEMLRSRQARPPMPWMNLNRMSDTDARSIYRFIASLGVKGERMPAAVDSSVEPVTPYFVLEPQHMERLAPPGAGGR